ncbi:MAG: cobyrinate a,c-diamide synthase [Huintestinicola sp.]
MNRIMIAGTHSGCGKTTVTCAVLRALVNRGLKTASFKCGPDYIDPMFHSRIIGTRSRNLDSFFCSPDALRRILYENGSDCHISVIEGVMGYYDGISGEASSYTTAVHTVTPAVIVIDCRGMSTSLGAVAKGFLTYKEPAGIAGFIFDRLHESLVSEAEGICRELGTEFLGYLPKCPECTIESRHLGLVTADEITDLTEKTDILAELAEKHIRLDRLVEIAASAPMLSYTPLDISPLLDRTADRPVRIAVASDKAFCFRYEENLDILRRAGCETVFFSPMNDRSLPESIGGLILSGGYPELYADKLSANISMLTDIRTRISEGLPVIAECGGFMYLGNTLEDNNGNVYPMAGVINTDSYKTPSLCRFGYTYLTAAEDNLLCRKGERLTAHEFHRWDSTDCGKGFEAVKVRSGAEYPACHASENMYAGFPHLYFGGDPRPALRFAEKCRAYSEGNK